MDRTHNGPVMVGSAQGGMDIEAVAEATPDAIFTLPIDITTGAPLAPPIPPWFGRQFFSHIESHLP